MLTPLLDRLRETKYDYVRQVDLHSHWIGLAMLMIVLGVVFDEVAFGERARYLDRSWRCWPVRSCFRWE